MPTSIDHHPLTIPQTAQLHDDLTIVEEKLEAITTLMRACHGEDSQANIRADETLCALQRVKWELERVKQKTSAAASGS